MAESQSTSESTNCYPHLYIRCYGEQNRVRYYLVYQSVPKTRFSTLQYRLRVVEDGERVTIFRSVSQDAVLRGTGGLLNPANFMTVSTASDNTVLGVLDSRSIDTSSEVPAATSFSWYLISVTPRECEQQRALCVRKAGVFTDKCRIYGLDSADTVVIKIVDTHFLDRLELPKMMVILTALRLYYQLHKYHERPMPVGILSMMSRGVPLCPDLSVLQDVDRVRLRVAAINHAGEYYIEVLIVPTHYIILVITASLEQDVLLIKDSFGELQCKLSQVTDSTRFMHLTDSKSRLFGTLDLELSEMTDNHDHTRPLRECKTVSKKESEGEKRLIFYHDSTSEDVEPVADYYQEKDTGILNLRLGQQLDVRKKALVLARAVKVAFQHFQMWENYMLPLLYSYPYRSR